MGSGIHQTLENVARFKFDPGCAIEKRLRRAYMPLSGDKKLPFKFGSSAKYTDAAAADFGE